MRNAQKEQLEQNFRSTTACYTRLKHLPLRSLPVPRFGLAAAIIVFADSIRKRRRRSLPPMTSLSKRKNTIHYNGETPCQRGKQFFVALPHSSLDLLAPFVLGDLEIRRSEEEA